ncbi:MAG: hypothetical protein MUO87_07580, partial [Thermoplasmata archaeon]|nr:hypothetical protein [Thermoplasmata archaeon]
GLMYERIGPRAPILSCAGALAAATFIIALFVDETHNADGKGGSEEPLAEMAPALERDSAVAGNLRP